ncbi:M15 family metallopeptidase [Halobacteriovorax sp. GB3]|uniref:M15 family metallopeptidase n=1 Tax=Halobacteriovorax sp. GB3 TaxID=2719615 RepID=UPI0023625BE8|nr:M15 family metallopeptidase [Halobacteriovorax sp. GB3]MDD0852375.1 M15 family metallopeptidase [Halobacteriovorax sp. GB3]
MNDLILKGQTTEHLIEIEKTHFLHRDVLDHYLTLKESANDFGLEIQLASSFRDFNRQVLIWNRKARGESPLLDSHSNPLPYDELSKEEILYSILRWSAFPGASRHHWGTDFDIIDKRALLKDPNYHVQLIPSEYEKGGIFERLGLFLEEHLESTPFYRPYEKDLGGVAREPWHLSFHAKAKEFQKQYDLPFFVDHLDALDSKEIMLLDLVKEKASDIYHRFIDNTY